MEPLLFSGFKDYVQKYRLFEPGDLVIAGISGGLDSVVLAHLLFSLKQPVALAHFNFQLRGAESLRDEQWVRDLAKKWELPLFIETCDTESYAGQHHSSIQVAARQLRYDFFERIRKQLSTTHKRVWIATAHHMNDSAETLLMNLFRGTGIDGLKGIPVKNGFIIRPLLFAGRGEIEAYAKDTGLTWVEDSSNAKNDYTRNLIRNAVLPMVEKKYPRVIQNLAATQQKMQDAAVFYHEMVDRRLQKMVVKEGNLQKVPVRKLAKATGRNTLVWEWIKQFGFTEGQAGEVVKLLDAANGSYIASEGYRLLRNRAWLILSPVGQINKAPVLLETLPGTMHSGTDKKVSFSGPQTHHSGKHLPVLTEEEEWVDAATLAFPLMLRPWKAGDYFYPLGMAKKKKVARFLIDRKLSPAEKENTWVLESNKRIVWVVGYRLDDRFKITGNTKEVVRMRVVSGG